MKTISENGNKIYIFDTINWVPKINEVDSHNERCRTFFESATLNPKKVNAKLYSLFSKETYSSFIYAFAYQLGVVSQSSCVSGQFEMNARRVERLCRKNEISLSTIEAMVIDKCKDFHQLDFTFDEKLALSNRFLSELSDLYNKKGQLI